MSLHPPRTDRSWRIVRTGRDLSVQRPVPTSRPAPTGRIATENGIRTGRKMDVFLWRELVFGGEIMVFGGGCRDAHFGRLYIQTRKEDFVFWESIDFWGKKYRLFLLTGFI